MRWILGLDRRVMWCAAALLGVTLTGCVPDPDSDKVGPGHPGETELGDSGTASPPDDSPPSGDSGDSGDTGGSESDDSGGADSGDSDTGDSDDTPMESEICDNGIDDDANGTADCADAACAGVGTCDCVDTDVGSLLGTLWTGSTTEAGDDVQGECTANAGGPDVQVLWTPPESGCFELSTEGSAFDTTLSVGAGWCGGPTLACNDDAPGSTQSRLTLSAQAGRSVLVVAEGYDTYEHGDLVLSAVSGEAFGETDDVDAGSNVGDGIVSGDLAGATTSIVHPCSDVPGPSSLVRWEAPASGSWTFTTVDSDFDASVTVFGQCSAALMCDDHLAGDRQASIEMFLSEGEVVHLAIGGVEEASGSWVLNVSGPD